MDDYVEKVAVRVSVTWILLYDQARIGLSLRQNHRVNFVPYVFWHEPDKTFITKKNLKFFRKAFSSKLIFNNKLKIILKTAWQDAWDFSKVWKGCIAVLVQTFPLLTPYDTPLLNYNNLTSIFKTLSPRLCHWLAVTQFFIHTSLD